MSKVSIIVITYNEEKNIDTCLQSLLKQDYPDCEIIVVDASEDKTADLVAYYSQIKLIKSSKKGFGVQRNLGIKHATGQYVAFTDADCSAPSFWLSKAISYLETTHHSGVGGNAYPPLDSPMIGKTIACLGYPAGGALGLDPIKDPLSTCNAIFLKKALDEIHGFDEKLIYGGEDTDICKRFTTKGYTVKIFPELFIYHKTRNFKEFLSWSVRRGRAKYHLNKSYKQLFMPLALFVYLFTSQFRKAIKRRKENKIPLFFILTLLPILFFLRQSCMTLGWVKEGFNQIQ